VPMDGASCSMCIVASVISLLIAFCFCLLFWFCIFHVPWCGIGCTFCASACNYLPKSLLVIWWIF
jgi:hypothetical protein